MRRVGESNDDHKKPYQQNEKAWQISAPFRTHEPDYRLGLVLIMSAIFEMPIDSETLVYIVGELYAQPSKTLS